MDSKNQAPCARTSAHLWPRDGNWWQRPRGTTSPLPTDPRVSHTAAPTQQPASLPPPTPRPLPRCRPALAPPPSRRQPPAQQPVAYSQPPSQPTCTPRRRCTQAHGPVSHPGLEGLSGAKEMSGLRPAEMGRGGGRCWGRRTHCPGPGFRLNRPKPTPPAIAVSPGPPCSPCGARSQAFSQPLRGFHDLPE